MRGRAIIAGVSIGALALIPASLAGASQYAHPKIHKWYVSQGGKRELSHLIKDLGKVSTDAGAQNLTAVGTDCQGLRNDAQIALAGRGIPSPGVQRLWVTALNDFQSAGTVCVNGVNDNSGSEIEQATSDITSGTALFTQITASL